MKNKKGFTLVELLAVIAILAILVVLAVPQVLKMFNESKVNTFVTQAQSIYKSAEQQYISDSIGTAPTDYYCHTLHTTSGSNKLLSLSGNEDLYYYIKFSTAENGTTAITTFTISDGSRSFSQTNASGVSINDISSATLQSSVTIPTAINCNPGE